MTVGELKAFLATCPDDAEVWHRDMNFGGRDQPLEPGEITSDGSVVLIDSIHFDYVD